jgi:lysozyme family protein
MIDNFEQSLVYVINSEGGYSNSPADPGGCTNLGVTQKTWENWVGHPVTEADMRALGPEDVTALYKVRYWKAVRGDELPRGVDYAVFDIAVNSGPQRAIKILQRVAKTDVDGVIGPKTLAAVVECDPKELILSICRARMMYLINIPEYATFGKGWTRRVNDVQTRALAMAS